MTTKPKTVNGEADPLPEEGIQDALPGLPTPETPPPADKAPKQPGAVRDTAGRFLKGAGGGGGRRKPPADKAPAAPKRGPGRPTNAESGAKLTKDLTTALQELCGVLAVLSLVSPKLAYDAQVIGDNADKLSGELVRLSKRMPWLDKALRALVASRDGTQLLVVLGAIGVPIAANHGLIPASMATMVGAPPPPTAAGDDLASVMDLFRSAPAPTPEQAAAMADHPSAYSSERFPQ